MKAMSVRRVGDSDKEEEFLKSRSPLFFVDRIKVPLLIGQGANDVRVAAGRKRPDRGSAAPGEQARGVRCLHRRRPRVSHARKTGCIFLPRLKHF